MKLVDPHDIATPERLTGRLQNLLTGFHFTCGLSDSCGDGEVEVVLTLLDCDTDRVDYLLTVYTGFPPVAAVRGLYYNLHPLGGRIASPWSGYLDRRGQARIEKLKRGDYRLTIGTRMSSIIPLSLAEQHVHRAAASSGTGPTQQFHSADGAIEAAVEFTDASELVLRVRAKTDDSGAGRLARFRLWNSQADLLAEGYLGLVDDAPGWAIATVRLDDIDATLRERITDWDLEITPQSAEDIAGLTTDLRSQAMRALDRSRSAASRLGAVVIDKARKDLTALGVVPER